MKKRLLGLGALVTALACATTPHRTEIAPEVADTSQAVPYHSLRQAIPEYCFRITPHTTIGIERITTTPEEFLNDREGVHAVVNGVYFGTDDKPEGIAYLAEGHHLATEQPQHTRGYFMVNKIGKDVTVDETMPGEFFDYWLVIGTHPLLVVHGEVHPQAREERYLRRRAAFRSALGTKDNRNICFAVSNEELLMYDWARELENAGYLGAINLDGGFYSQLAVRNESGITTTGHGKEALRSRLVIFAYEQ